MLVIGIVDVVSNTHFASLGWTIVTGMGHRGCNNDTQEQPEKDQQ